MNPEEITSIIKDQIKNYAVDLNVDEVGTVIETGYECKFVKPGDVVFYTIASETMVPFFRQGFVTVAENRVIAIVNENLTKRKENYGRKNLF